MKLILVVRKDIASVRLVEDRETLAASKVQLNTDLNDINQMATSAASVAQDWIKTSQKRETGKGKTKGAQIKAQAKAQAQSQMQATRSAWNLMSSQCSVWRACSKCVNRMSANIFVVDHRFG